MHIKYNADTGCIGLLGLPEQSTTNMLLKQQNLIFFLFWIPEAQDQGDARVDFSSDHPPTFVDSSFHPLSLSELFCSCQCLNFFLCSKQPYWIRHHLKLITPQRPYCHIWLYSVILGDKISTCIYWVYIHAHIHIHTHGVTYACHLYIKLYSIIFHFHTTQIG